VSAPLGIAYQVGKLPYAVLIDEHGLLRARGLINSREPPGEPDCRRRSSASRRCRNIWRSTPIASTLREALRERSMKWLDRCVEASTRGVAKRVSRRSFVTTLAGLMFGGATLPLLPVARVRPRRVKRDPMNPR
jgi:hypothetical protein